MVYGLQVDVNRFHYTKKNAYYDNYLEQDGSFYESEEYTYYEKTIGYSDSQYMQFDDVEPFVYLFDPVKSLLIVNNYRNHLDPDNASDTKKKFNTYKVASADLGDRHNTVSP
jgi:hypothetical protein